jgi:tetratricopeptide (TPR) repeat protein
MRDRTIKRLASAAMSVTAVILAVGCHGKKPPVVSNHASNLQGPARPPEASSFDSDAEVISLRGQIKTLQDSIDSAAATRPVETQPSTAPSTQSADTTQPATQSAPEDPVLNAEREQLIILQARLSDRIVALQAAADAAKAASTLPFATTQPVTEPTTVPMPDTMPTTVPATTEPSTMAATMPATMPSTMPTSMPSTMPTSMPAIADEPPSSNPDVSDGDKALAPQLEAMSALVFAGDNRSNNPLMFKLVAARLGAALSLDPSEPRYARKQAEALQDAGDFDGEYTALKIAVALKPDDEPSQIRLIDLNLAQPDLKENAAASVQYLQSLIGKPAVPDDVKSYAAFRCAMFMLERGEDDAAQKIIAQGLRSNPVNFELLRLKLKTLPADATPYLRLQIMLDLLRANPLQPRVSLSVADALAQFGLAEEATEFYKLTDDTLSAYKVDDAEIRVDWAAELFILDLANDAKKMNTGVLQTDPALPSALFLQLAMTRSDASNAQYLKTYDQAMTAFSNRVIEACNKSGAVPQATTRPIDVGGPMPLPDLMPVASKLKTAATPRDVALRDEFIEAVADLGLLQVYFGSQPADASPLIDALAAVAPDGSPEVARLRGWAQLRAGKKEDAKATLTGVAKLDPISAMGLVKLMSDDPAQAMTTERMAREVIQQHPAGVYGAILKQGMQNAHVMLIPGTEAESIRQLVAAFPQKWESLPQSPADFYSVNVRPVSRGVAYGEPLLGQVSLTNLTDQPLTVGDEGVVKPSFLFAMTPALPDAVAVYSFDHYAGPIVIQHGASMVQTSRVDQTQLIEVLESVFGGPNFEINGTVITNQSAPCGERHDFTETFVRLRTQRVGPDVDQLLKDLSSGRPEATIDALSMARGFWLMDKQILKGKNPPAAVGIEASNLEDAIRRARADGVPAVSAWAAFCESSLMDDKGRENLIEDLARDPDWRHRQIALAMTKMVDPKVAIGVARYLEWDTQSSVRAEARALIPLFQNLIDHPPQPTTRPMEPATGPTTEPTGGPATEPTSGPVAPMPESATTVPTTVPTNVPAVR